MEKYTYMNIFSNDGHLMLSGYVDDAVCRDGQWAISVGDDENTHLNLTGGIIIAIRDVTMPDGAKKGLFLHDA